MAAWREAERAPIAYPGFTYPLDELLGSPQVIPNLPLSTNFNIRRLSAGYSQEAADHLLAQFHQVTQDRHQHGWLVLPPETIEDPRDRLLCAQHIAAVAQVIDFIAHCKKKDTGGIVLLAGPMGANKTSVAIHTLLALRNQSTCLAFANQNELARYGQVDTLASNLGVEFPKAIGLDQSDAALSVIFNWGYSPDKVEVVGLFELLFLLAESQKVIARQGEQQVETSALETLLDLAQEKKVVFIIDALAHFATTQFTPPTAALLNMLTQRQDVDSRTLYLFSKDSLDSSRLTPITAPVMWNPDNTLTMAHPTKTPILRVLPTASLFGLQPNEPALFPLSLETMMALAAYHQFVDFAPSSDVLAAVNRADCLPLFNAIHPDHWPQLVRHLGLGPFTDQFANPRYLPRTHLKT